MKENLIKTIQKFLNSPFRYKELLIILDKQKDLLLNEKILENTEECEYNALWDTIMYLEKKFLFAKEPNLIIGTETSLMAIFNYNFKLRQENFKTKTKS